MRDYQSKQRTRPTRCGALTLLTVFIITALCMGAFCHFVTTLALPMAIMLSLWCAGSVCLCLYAVTQQRQPRRPALIMAEMMGAGDQLGDTIATAPIAPSQDRNALRTAVPSIVATKIAAPRILLVDDNLMNRQLALLRLRTLGYDADGVADGETALQALQDADYGMVLMDCQMPQMDGFETTRRIRRAERGGDRHLPIVAWTCLEYDPQRCFAAGMDDYLAKPLDGGHFEQMLARWLPL